MGASTPFEYSPGRLDRLVGHLHDLSPVELDFHAPLAGIYYDAVESVARSPQRLPGLHHHPAAHREAEMLGTAQRPLQTRRRDLQRVAPGQWIAEVETPGDLLGNLRDGVQVHPVGGIHEDPHDRAPGRAAQFDVPQAEGPAGWFRPARAPLLPPC